MRLALALIRHPLTSSLVLTAAVSAASTLGSLAGQELYLLILAKRRRKALEAQRERR